MTSFSFAMVLLVFAPILPRVMPARVSDAGCEFSCGARSVTKDGVTFQLGEGAGVDFRVREDHCLKMCELAKPGVMGWRSDCEAVLPGSTKVSKNKGFKLCCMTRACTASMSEDSTTTTRATTTTIEPATTTIATSIKPTTTITTTSMTSVNLAEQFTCVDGQGPGIASYTQTRGNSFEACASLCYADDACQSFDFTEEAAHNSCQLYRIARLPLQNSTSRREFCKKVNVEEGDFELEYLTDSELSGCSFECGADAVTTRGGRFKIGFNAGAKHQPSLEKCLGHCAVVHHKSVGTAFCSAVLPGSDKVSQHGDSKLCCMSEQCPSTQSQPVLREAASNVDSAVAKKYECKQDEVCVVTRSYPCEGDWMQNGLRPTTQNPPLVSRVGKAYRRCKPKNVGILKQMRWALADKIKQPSRNDNCRTSWFIRASNNRPDSEQIWHSRDAEDGDDDKAVCKQMLHVKNLEICELFKNTSGQYFDQYKKCKKHADASRCPLGCIHDYDATRAKEGLA